VRIFALVGGVYLNFALWFLALVPAWLVVRRITGDGNVTNTDVPAWTDESVNVSEGGEEAVTGAEL